MKRLLCMLLVFFLLCGCNQVSEHTSSPPIPLPEETTVVTSRQLQDLSQFQSMLTYSEAAQNWIPFALGCVFDSPQDIDLEFMFYLGTDNMGWHNISEESEQELIEAGFMREMDLQVMSVSTLESALQCTFNISLAEVSIPESWYYLAAEDAYCSNNNDAYFVGLVTVTSVTEYSDGTTKVHYTANAYYDTKTDLFYDMANLILTLKKHNGNLVVYSNEIEGIG